MARSESIRIGKGGTLVLPASLRRPFHLEEGTEVIAEATTEGILIRSATSPEPYTDERKAELLLTNAVDEADYRKAREAVEAMGLDPDAIEHVRP